MQIHPDKVSEYGMPGFTGSFGYYFPLNLKISYLLLPRVTQQEVLIKRAVKCTVLIGKLFT